MVAGGVHGDRGRQLLQSARRSSDQRRPAFSPKSRPSLGPDRVVGRVPGVAVRRPHDCRLRTVAGRRTVPRSEPWGPDDGGHRLGRPAADDAVRHDLLHHDQRHRHRVLVSVRQEPLEPRIDRLRRRRTQREPTRDIALHRIRDLRPSPVRGDEATVGADPAQPADAHLRRLRRLGIRERDHVRWRHQDRRPCGSGVLLHLPGVRDHGQRVHRGTPPAIRPVGRTRRGRRPGAVLDRVPLADSAHPGEVPSRVSTNTVRRSARTS